MRTIAATIAKHAFFISTSKSSALLNFVSATLLQAGGSHNALAVNHREPAGGMMMFS
jgi:hypothetical protein